MIDLDDRIAASAAARPWAEPDAVELATSTAGECGLRIQYEPADERWVLLFDLNGYAVMISVDLPLVICRADLVGRIGADGLSVIAIPDFYAEILRCSADVLRRSVLTHGWAEDFDPERFCANDLFIESV